VIFVISSVLTLSGIGDLGFMIEYGVSIGVRKEITFRIPRQGR
jgi:hypothetical protein